MKNQLVVIFAFILSGASALYSQSYSRSYQEIIPPVRSNTDKFRQHVRNQIISSYNDQEHFRNRENEIRQIQNSYAVARTTGNTNEIRRIRSQVLYQLSNLRQDRMGIIVSLMSISNSYQDGRIKSNLSIKNLNDTANKLSEQFKGALGRDELWRRAESAQELQNIASNTFNSMASPVAIAGTVGGGLPGGLLAGSVILLGNTLIETANWESLVATDYLELMNLPSPKPGMGVQEWLDELMKPENMDALADVLLSDPTMALLAQPMGIHIGDEDHLRELRLFDLQNIQRVINANHDQLVSNIQISKNEAQRNAEVLLSRIEEISKQISHALIAFEQNNFSYVDALFESEDSVFGNQEIIKVVTNLGFEVSKNIFAYAVRGSMVSAQNSINNLQGSRLALKEKNPDSNLLAATEGHSKERLSDMKKELEEKGNLILAQSELIGSLGGLAYTVAMLDPKAAKYAKAVSHILSGSVHVENLMKSIMKAQNISETASTLFQATQLIGLAASSINMLSFAVSMSSMLGGLFGGQSDPVFELLQQFYDDFKAFRIDTERNFDDVKSLIQGLYDRNQQILNGIDELKLRINLVHVDVRRILDHVENIRKIQASQQVDDFYITVDQIINHAQSYKLKTILPIARSSVSEISPLQLNQMNRVSNAETALVSGLSNLAIKINSLFKPGNRESESAKVARAKLEALCLYSLSASHSIQDLRKCFYGDSIKIIEDIDKEKLEIIKRNLQTLAHRRVAANTDFFDVAARIICTDVASRDGSTQEKLRHAFVTVFNEIGIPRNSSDRMTSKDCGNQIHPHKLSSEEMDLAVLFARDLWKAIDDQKMIPVVREVGFLIAEHLKHQRYTLGLGAWVNSNISAITASDEVLRAYRNKEFAASYLEDLRRTADNGLDFEMIMNTAPALFRLTDELHTIDQISRTNDKNFGIQNALDRITLTLAPTRTSQTLPPWEAVLAASTALHGYDTFDLLLSQLINLRNKALHSVRNAWLATLSDASKIYFQQDGASLEDLINSPRNQSPASRFSKIAKRLEISSTQNEASQKSHSKDFATAERTRSEAASKMRYLQDFMEWVFQIGSMGNNQDRVSYIHYQAAIGGEPKRFSFPVPRAHPTNLINESSSVILLNEEGQHEPQFVEHNGKITDLFQEERSKLNEYKQFTMKPHYLVFHKNDQMIQAIRYAERYQSEDNHQSRILMIPQRALTEFFDYTDQHSNKIIKGRVMTNATIEKQYNYGRSKSFKIAIQVPVINGDPINLIRRSYGIDSKFDFHPSEIFISQPTQAGTSNNPLLRDTEVWEIVRQYQSKFKKAFEVVQPEIEAAKKRGELVRKLINDQENWAQRISENQSLAYTLRPSLSPLFSIFSSNLATQFSPSNKFKDDQNLRSDLSNSYELSPENMVLLVVYINEDESRLSSLASTGVRHLSYKHYDKNPWVEDIRANSNSNSSVKIVRSWHYFGPHFFQRWHMELTRAESMIQEAQQKSFAAFLSDLRTEIGEAQNDQRLNDPQRPALAGQDNAFKEYRAEGKAKLPEELAKFRTKIGLQGLSCQHLQKNDLKFSAGSEFALYCFWYYQYFYPYVSNIIYRLYHIDSPDTNLVSQEHFSRLRDWIEILSPVRLESANIFKIVSSDGKLDIRSVGQDSLLAMSEETIEKQNEAVANLRHTFQELERSYGYLVKDRSAVFLNLADITGWAQDRKDGDSWQAYPEEEFLSSSTSQEAFMSSLIEDYEGLKR